MKATVIVPTHGDRGPLLPHSLGSVLNQTESDLEIFVFGDGVSDDTRRVIQSLQQGDERIRFFDDPKDGRRGEARRHRHLREARGDIVCYLCDRDLMLPDHIDIMHGLLQQHNFAHTLMARIVPDGRVLLNMRRYNLQRKADVDWIVAPERTYSLGLSVVAHTLEHYRELPHGWRETPSNVMTDHYMWAQFLVHPHNRPVSSDELSILYFPRGYAPGAPSRTVSQWLDEFAAWESLLADPAALQGFREGVTRRALAPHLRAMEVFRNRLERHPALRRSLRAMPRLHRPLLRLYEHLAQRRAAGGGGTRPPAAK